ncbi:hypothetical protein EXD82_06090 [Peptacetobacter hominis]|uniref:ABC transporter permease n=1 Tax=Peptacetobacter hominis TaxID=2743610 RepID=A0A544QV51_9FIRM|nr:hypothetical protein [Peptacetobacter hominis]TQQ84557.1 hypothetical protein EXD82_06090 [Peptacetobacter hominis]
MKNINKKDSIKNKSFLIMLIVVVIASGFLFSVNTIQISHLAGRADVYNNIFGDYDTEYVDIEKEKMTSVKNDANIYSSDNVQNLGKLINTRTGMSSELKSINGYDDKEKKSYFEEKGRVLEGRLPKNNNEIVVDYDTIINLGLGENPIGKTVNFELRKNYMSENGEQKVYSDMKKFEIVGLVKRKYYDKDIINQVDVGRNNIRRTSYIYGNFDGNTIIPDEAVSYDLLVKFKGGEKFTSKELIDNIYNTAKKYNIGQDSIYPEKYSINRMKTTENAVGNVLRTENVILAAAVIFVICNIISSAWRKVVEKEEINDIKSYIIKKSAMIGIYGTVLGIIFGAAVSKLSLIVLRDERIKNIANDTLYIHINTIMYVVLVSVVSVAAGTSLAIKMTSEKSRVYSKVMNIISVIMSIYIVTYTVIGIPQKMDYSSSDIEYIHDLEINTPLNSDIDRFKTEIIDVDTLNKYKNVGTVDKQYLKTAGITVDSESTSEDFKRIMGIDRKGMTEYINHIRFIDNVAISEKISSSVEDGNPDELKDIGKYVNVALYNYVYDKYTNKYSKAYNQIKVGDIINISVNHLSGNKIEKRTIPVRVCAVLNETWGKEGNRIRDSKPEIIVSDRNVDTMIGDSTYNNIYVDYDKDISKNSIDNIEFYAEHFISRSILSRSISENKQVISKHTAYERNYVNTLYAVGLAIINTVYLLKSDFIRLDKSRRKSATK